MLPMAFGKGIGAGMRNDIGLASAGGILISGALTLYVMPILYDFFTRKPKTRPGGEPETDPGWARTILIYPGSCHKDG